MSKYGKFCKSLGLKVPIIQAPMAGISTIKLASEATANGALGSLPLATIDFRKGIDPLKKTIEQYKENLLETKVAHNVVNLNFFCHEVVENATKDQMENWWSLYLQSGLKVSDEVRLKIPFSNGNVSFKELELHYPEKLHELINYLAEYKPKMVSFHFGHPEKKTVEKFKEAGILVFVCVTSVEEAKILVDLGANGLICQGFEAGGHRGNFLVSGQFDELLSTHSLFLQVKNYIERGNISTFLIPSGGIMDAVTINYYLSLGASAVQMGSAFLATPESNSAPYFQKELARDEQETTVATSLVSGKLARTVKTQFIENLIVKNAFKSYELPPYGSSYNAYKTLKPQISSSDIGFYLAGQNYHSIDPKLTTSEIIQKLSKDLQ